jgi:hypothetical protein
MLRNEKTLCKKETEKTMVTLMRRKINTRSQESFPTQDVEKHEKKILCKQ